MNESSSSTSASSMLAGKSDGEIEDILDRMLTRLALCDDSKLQDLLSKLLPLSISALSSPSQPVRNKVLEILNHVNKRIKHQQEIGLPLLELWKLYMECSFAPMVRNFCVVYIEMAIDRAPKEDKENLIPTFLGIISKLPSQHQEILLRISTKVIGECYSMQVSDEVADNYKNHGGLQDTMIFLDFGLHNLLYQATSQSERCPAGLSITQRDRVSGKKPLTSDMLQIRKLGILNIVQAMDLPSELVYPLYLAASVDRYLESVARRGDELLKKNTSGVNLEDINLINRLFLLFNGHTGPDQVPPDSRVTPASPSLRVKLMIVFCRSILAANSFPSTLQCIFGCIFGKDIYLFGCIYQ
ncbi:hypothetical protein M9H77_17657 [Catharanthus roseus]|uniref:Uncharacterized protein n=1 Tax=Catharanthus roseus TaxID=4058 RepID=A0ACC0B585_CATRO|nr:hypothetical protein M9H77_17657 [Catharanthus roseus]